MDKPYQFKYPRYLGVHVAQAGAAATRQRGLSARSTAKAGLCALAGAGAAWLLLAWLAGGPG